jgi:hypothetical protein
MLQMVMQVSPESRITSYSISFQPSSERSTSTCPTGLALMPDSTTRLRSSIVKAVPPPVPPRVKAGRMMSGRPIFAANCSASSIVCATTLSATGSPICWSSSLNSSRSSAVRIDSTGVPRILTA